MIDPPVITQQPANIIALTNQSVVFHVVATGTAPLSYQWYFNTNSLSAETKTDLSLSNITTNDSGTYYVTITNAGGVATSSVAQLSVYTTTVPTMAITYSNNAVLVELAGVPAYPYLIQGSTDLINWIPLQTNASPFTFTETNTSLLNIRFYRGSYQPE